MPKNSNGIIPLSIGSPFVKWAILAEINVMAKPAYAKSLKNIAANPSIRAPNPEEGSHTVGRDLLCKTPLQILACVS